jgi:hypothetical protein
MNEERNTRTVAAATRARAFRGRAHSRHLVAVCGDPRNDGMTSCAAHLARMSGCLRKRHPDRLITTDSCDTYFDSPLSTKLDSPCFQYDSTCNANSRQQKTGSEKFASWRSGLNVISSATVAIPSTHYWREAMAEKLAIEYGSHGETHARLAGKIRCSANCTSIELPSNSGRGVRQ